MDDLSIGSQDLRGLAFSIAYRMLGSVAEAEDVAQESLLRLHRTADEGQVIESPRAFVATVATRLAIDHLRSACATRERYVGLWLPEPIVTDADEGPEAEVELAETISMALLVVLETLSPVERAVFVLREAFGFDYEEIAGIVGKTETNVRQIASRARKHVEARRPRFDATREQRDALADVFFSAAQEGDVDRLVSVLADDVVMYGDGGGKAAAAARPIEGRESVARFLAGLARIGRRMGVRVRRVRLNGDPGALAVGADGTVINAMALEVSERGIVGIRAVVNPEKLARLGAGAVEHPR